MFQYSIKFCVHYFYAKIRNFCWGHHRCSFLLVPSGYSYNKIWQLWCQERKIQYHPSFVHIFLCHNKGLACDIWHQAWQTLMAPLELLYSVCQKTLEALIQPWLDLMGIFTNRAKLNLVVRISVSYRVLETRTLYLLHKKLVLMFRSATKSWYEKVSAPSLCPSRV